MNKIQLFTAPTTQSLQADINKWLADHKNVHIVHTNLTSVTRVNVLNGDKNKEDDFAFYILYVPENQEEIESVMQASMEMPSELIDPQIIEGESN